MKGYTSIAKLENYLLLTIDTDFYEQIQNWIEQAESHIDRYTGRNFIADAVASEKVYDGDNSDTLLIDEAVEVTKVEVDDVEKTTYYQYPANALPKRKIRLSDDVFARGMQNVSVTAKWGYSVACPADISFAAMVLVAGIINNSNNDGDVQSEKIGNYQVSYSSKGMDDFAKAGEILNSYKKYAL